MTVLLVGTPHDDHEIMWASNFTIWSQFTAIATGIMSEVHAYNSSGGTAHAKVAIYANNAGVPGTRLSYDNVPQNLAVGWNTLTIPNVNIVGETIYWLAIIFDTDGGCSRTGNYTQQVLYESNTYSTYTFPDPAPGGLSGTASYMTAIAGYGTLPVVKSFGGMASKKLVLGIRVIN